MAFPAYLRYTELSQTQFVSSDLSFANPDQEEGLPDTGKELKGYGLGTVLMMSLWNANPFGQSSHLFPRLLSFRQKTLILRC